MTSPWASGDAAARARVKQVDADNLRAVSLILGVDVPESLVAGECICANAGLVAIMTMGTLAQTVTQDYPEDFDSAYATSLVAMLSYCAMLAPKALEGKRRAPVSRGFIERFSRYIRKEMDLVRIENEVARS